MKKNSYNRKFSKELILDNKEKFCQVEGGEKLKKKKGKNYFLKVKVVEIN